MNSKKKAVNRYFNGAEKMRLIVSVETTIVNEIDQLISYPHPARHNRSEFIRQVIVEKLGRDKENSNFWTH